MAMSVKRGLLPLVVILGIMNILSFCSAHVCSDVISGGSQAVHGCPDPMKTIYVSHSFSGNVVTLLSDVTANHVEFYPRCSGTEAQGCYRDSDHDYGCNDCCDYKSGFTVQRFNKYSGGSGDMNQITLDSSPSTPKFLSDRQTQRFTIRLTVNPSAPAQTFKVGVSMTGSLSGTARPIYVVTINWEPDEPAECTTANQATACNDNNPCTNDICSSGTCTHPAISNCCTSSSQCNDNDVCTQDSCSSNRCVNSPISNCCISSYQCNDNNICTTDSCSSNRCVNSPISNCCTSSSQCNDNDVCTQDSCTNNRCINTQISNCCTSSSQCNDNDACTTDSCSSNRCTHSAITACLNNDGCCPPGCDYTNDNNCLRCTSLNQFSACNDNNPCTVDNCLNGQCANTRVGDLVSCNEGKGKCCGGVCNTVIGNSNFSSECRSGPACVGSSWQYVAANEGEACSGGTCYLGNCLGGEVPIPEEEPDKPVPTGSVYYATQTQLSKGHTKPYSSGDALKVNLDGKQHTVVVNSVSSTTVRITVSSTPQEAVLSIGETKKFSFVEGWYNLQVTFHGLIGSGSSAQANITVKDIEEKIPGYSDCVESWRCDEWSKCSHGKQVRDCRDVNNCGTSKSKPSTEKDCKNTGKGILITFFILIIILGIVVAVLFLKKKSKNKKMPPAPPIQPARKIVPFTGYRQY